MMLIAYLYLLMLGICYNPCLKIKLPIIDHKKRKLLVSLLLIIIYYDEKIITNNRHGLPSYTINSILIENLL